MLECAFRHYYTNRICGSMLNSIKYAWAYRSGEYLEHTVQEFVGFQEFQGSGGLAHGFVQGWTCFVTALEADPFKQQDGFCKFHLFSTKFPALEHNFSEGLTHNTNKGRWVYQNILKSGRNLITVQPHIWLYIVWGLELGWKVSSLNLAFILFRCAGTQWRNEGSTLYILWGL